MKTFEIGGHIVEFIPETHQYLVDGLLTPCVSNILAYKFNDYGTVSRRSCNVHPRKERNYTKLLSVMSETERRAS
jgi:hypothetical protein